MAQINFNSIQSNENSFSGNSVDFFSLKNDGDTAIVRFMHDTVESFELLTVHDITLNDKYRKANCIRQPNDPMENCPLCAAGKKVQQKIFIHLIQYVQDGNTIVGIPKVWERPTSYAYKLKNLIDEYGPLSNSVFKIKRNGAAGSKETTYDIMFCNPAVYNNDYYPQNPTAFDNYTALGTIVLDKNFDELLTYMNTGVFPQVQKENKVENPANTMYTEHVNPNMSSTVTYNDMNEMQRTVNMPGLSNQPTTPMETPVLDAMTNPSGVINNNFNPTYNNGQFNTQQTIQRPVRSYN